MKSGSSGAVIGLLALCLPPLCQQPTPCTAYLRRVGPVQVGMTIAQARVALGDSSATGTADECTYLESAKLPSGVAAMLSKGSVVRIDVRSTQVRTASGVGLNDTEDRVRAAYKGHIKVAPHPYEGDDGHYLIYTPSDSADRQYQIIFETYKGKVTSYRVGILPHVGYIEGCS